MLWSLGLSPIGSTAKGICLFISVGCGVESIRSSRKLTEELAEQAAVAAMNEELEVLELSLATEREEQNLKKTYFPEIYAPEVKEELVHSLEALFQEPSSDIPEKTSTSQSERKALYKAVKELMENGKSATFIVEKILRQGGRNLSKGQQMLNELLEEGEKQGW